MLSRISQTEKDEYCYVLTYKWNLKKPKFMGTEKRLVVARCGEMKTEENG